MDVAETEINPPHGGMSTNSTVRAPDECQKYRNATNCQVHVPLVIDDRRLRPVNGKLLNECLTGKASAPHSVTAGDSSLNNQAADRFVDELTEVVKIGQSAATEVSGNVTIPEETITAIMSLSILSEAATTAGPPRYDTSPQVQVDKLHGHTPRGFLEPIQEDDISPPSYIDN